MNKSDSCSFRRDLGNGLVIRTAAGPDDIERITECDINVFKEEGIAWMHRKLFMHHPNMKLDDLIFVEDENTGRVVSTLCLLSWEICYENARLKVGEMGIVGTLEPYRRRGLIRAQAGYFKELLSQRGFDLSIIQGIAYFYRQFGYEYSLPLEGGYRMELHQIPDPGENKTESLIFRNANADDIPTLERLYNEAALELDIHTHREEAIWRYFLAHNPITQTAFEIWVVENNKKVLGYFHIQKHPFGEALTVNEVSLMGYDTAMAVLRYLKKVAMERNKPNIRLNLPAGCVLSRLAKYYGAQDLGNYAWQIHVPDMARFMCSIGSVLERRIAESPFAGLTEILKFNFYEEAVQLHFDNGKLMNVQKMKPGGGPIRVPPRASIPLVFGSRSREELLNSWPDIGMPPKEAYLIDVMFPKMTSWLYNVY